MSFFTADRITAGYGGKPVISDISFTAEAGTLTGILGANGSGKTTLLKAICGIIPHSGLCAVDGTVLDKLKPKQLARLCSYIPQRSGISIDISALDVVLMGFNPHLRLLDHPNSEMKSSAMSALARVGLSGRENDNYQTLSEGQKQLCILARTLASDAQLLLLDEPESALDFNFRYNIMDIVMQSVREDNRAAVVTLHDPQLALHCCDRLILLNGGSLLTVLDVKNTSEKQIENSLSDIYGDIKILSCLDSSGKKHLVMLREGRQ